MYEMSKLLGVLKDKNYPLEDKQWVLVTIDPERDTAESIDKYAKGFAEEFIGVRGSRPMLLNLATQLAVNNVMPSHKHMDHSHLDNHVNNIILINPDAEFAGFFRPKKTCKFSIGIYKNYIIHMIVQMTMIHMFMRRHNIVNSKLCSKI